MKIFTEFIEFAMQNKKWWLIPFFLMLLFLSAVLYLGSGTVASPFIYTIF
ncbi:hypothetical protein K2X05_03945 [bacterium]|nr:hypothetical protein [bacterium]